MQNIKVLMANVASWVGTLISFQVVKDALQIVAILGSIAVSLASVWWIRRQAKLADERHDKAMKE